MSWYSNKPHIDLNQLVPVFLRVDRCRHIENLDLRLDGRFVCRFQRDGSGTPTLELTEKPEFLDLFARQKVNLNVLCGINGVGKTSILKLLSGKLPTGRGDKYVFILRDDAGNFVASERMVVKHDRALPLMLDQPLDWADLSMSGLCANRVLDGDDAFIIWKNIADHYVRHRELYDDEKIPLFTDVAVEFWNPDELASEIAGHLSDRLGWNVSGLDIDQFLKSHPAFFAILYEMGDNTFDRLFASIKQGGKVKNIEALHTLLSGFDPRGVIERRCSKLIGLPRSPAAGQKKTESTVEVMTRILADHQPRAYPICTYWKTKKRMETLSTQLDTAFKRFAHHLRKQFNNHHFHVWEGGLDRVLYLRPFKKFPTGRRFLNDLSSGEFIDIKNRYILHPCMAQRGGSWLYQDEPDLHLHPEWKRQYIAKFLHAVEVTRKYLARVDTHYRDKVYTIILTTHSPFILSDVTNDHVILLDLDRQGRTSIRPSQSGTFAGNIGAMFYDQFFMKETIGRFAEETLNVAIKRLRSSRRMSHDERSRIEKLFSAVGDPLLRKLLLAKLEERIT